MKDLMETGDLITRSSHITPAVLLCIFIRRPQTQQLLPLHLANTSTKQGESRDRLTWRDQLQEQEERQEGAGSSHTTLHGSCQRREAASSPALDRYDLVSLNQAQGAALPQVPRCRRGTLRTSTLCFSFHSNILLAMETRINLVEVLHFFLSSSQSSSRVRGQATVTPMARRGAAPARMSHPSTGAKEELL